jgi:hypothetical protein
MRKMPEGKLEKLNATLMGVENQLMKRAMERQGAELDRTHDFLRDLDSQGVIDFVETPCCGGDKE